MMSTNDHGDFPPGISGPRRPTQEPVETAGANAEAQRMADELGVSSSVRLSSVRQDEHSPTSGGTKPKKKGFKVFSRSSSTGEDAKSYQAVPESGDTSGVGLLGRGGESSAKATGPSPDVDDPFGTRYGLPAGIDPPQLSVTSKRGDEHGDDRTVRTEEPHMFDANGNLAPYREGPYDFHHDEDGRLIKKRWCKFRQYRCVVC